MKQLTKNIFILLLCMAALVVIVWFAHTKITLALIVFLQIATLLAIGGTNLKGTERNGQDEQV